MSGIFPDPVIKDPKVEPLTILAEEAAEIIQEVTKALRFGIDHRYPAKDYDAKLRIYSNLPEAWLE